MSDRSIGQIIRCVVLLLFLSTLWFFISSLTHANTSNPQRDRTLFSQPQKGLQGEDKLNFFVGRGIFRKLWVTAPASTQASDGLGPLYNARSCMACHTNNSRSQPGGDARQLVVRIDIPPQNNLQHQNITNHLINNVPEPTYGIQLQNFAIAGHKAEYQTLDITYTETPVTLGDKAKVSLRKPTLSINGFGYGPIHPKVRYSARVAPQIIGLGLLEAINEKDILANTDPDDQDNDGISGRANWVWSNTLNKVSLGRFGLKAEKPTLNDQVQSAFFIDIGLSVPLHTSPTGDCTTNQPNCPTAPDGNSKQYDNLEVSQQMIDLVNLYVSHIAVPAQRQPNNPNTIAGKKIFKQIGCNRCHTPSYITGNQSSAIANHNKEIFPYTDMLLHDMGDGLADNRPEGKATGKEWRTAPLWGIGLSEKVSGHNFYLHDGRARSILEAILWHGGEAKKQRDAVVALDKESREQLLTFIKSL